MDLLIRHYKSGKIYWFSFSRIQFILTTTKSKTEQYFDMCAMFFRWLVSICSILQMTFAYDKTAHAQYVLREIQRKCGHIYSAGGETLVG